MKKVKLVLEYDGTKYAGFQIQPKLLTVQGELEKALQELTGDSVRVIAAGRTDAGVHAMHQVVSFVYQGDLPVKALTPLLNRLLPKDIQVREGLEVGSDFDARRSAKERTYVYTILEGSYLPLCFKRHAILVKEKEWLDLESIKEAASCLIGWHDFESFSATEREDHSYRREIKSIEIKSFALDDILKGRLLVAKIVGNAFLYRMVRRMMGLLLEVGKGRIKPERVQEILDKKDRSLIKITLPPEGLTLAKVEY